MSQHTNPAAPFSFPASAAHSRPIAGAPRRSVPNSQLLNTPAIAGLIALLVVGAMYSVLALADDSSELSSPLTLTLICLAVGLVPAVVQATRRRFDIFEPIHLVAAACTLLTGVRALYLITYQTAVYSRVPGDELIDAALVLSILGIFAIYSGYYSGIGDNLAASIRPWGALWIGESRYPTTIITLAAKSV